jgi:exopolysaccharide biosynthesis polyprenyl glycosylphosphotransferase
VISVLKGRLRTTDEFGYLDGRRIGVVLLDAPATQAWLIADAVLGDWPPELPRPACDVFSYPNREPIVARASPEERPGDEVNVNRPGSIAASAQLARPIQRMEPLFSRGMPAWKRGVDIIGSTVGLVLAAPVIGLAVIAIRLSSPGPAIFRQERAGHCGVPFTIFKLRTMQLDADARKQELSGQNEQDGPAFKITNDPRVTPLGRYLRKTSIDELPQLWNVLRGEMSLVGPRPERPEYVALFSDQIDRYGERHRVKAGITGWAQVHGLRGQTSLADRVEWDNYYIENWSLWLDVKILLLTIIAIVRPSQAE